MGCKRKPKPPLVTFEDALAEAAILDANNRARHDYTPDPTAEEIAAATEIIRRDWNHLRLDRAMGMLPVDERKFDYYTVPEIHDPAKTGRKAAHRSQY